MDAERLGFMHIATLKIRNKQSARDEVLIKWLYRVILKSVRVIYVAI